MDWTNSRREASDIDYAVRTERGMRKNPNSHRLMAAILGAVDAIPGGGGDMYSRARANYPVTYRAAQAAAIAPIALMAPKVGLPWAAIAAARDPIVQQYYNDNIAPRPQAADLAQFLQQGGP